MAEPIIRLRRVTKTFGEGATAFQALKGIDLGIDAGDFVAVMGPSGSGKSTTMNILGCLDQPTSGDYYLDEQRVSSLSEQQLAKVRNRSIGFVFQNYNLLPRMPAVRQVELPLIYRNAKRREALAVSALQAVGLGERLYHRPTEMSGGQQQRVAIARALVTEPALILADEPTGNLDAASANEVLTMLSRLNQDYGKTVIMVTHDPHAAKFASKIRHLEKGELLPEGQVPEDWAQAAAR